MSCIAFKHLLNSAEGGPTEEKKNMFDLLVQETFPIWVSKVPDL